MYTRPVNAKGQITIPKEVRKNSNISEGDQLVIIPIDNGFIVKKVDEKKTADFLLIDTRESYNA